MSRSETMYEALLEKIYPDGWGLHHKDEWAVTERWVQYTLSSLEGCGANKLLTHFEQLLETNWELVIPRLGKLTSMNLYSRYHRVVPDRAWEDFVECQVPECGMLMVKGTHGLHNKAHHDTGEASTKPKRQTFGWGDCLRAMTQHYGVNMQAPVIVGIQQTKNNVAGGFAFTEPTMKLVGSARVVMTETVPYSRTTESGYRDREDVYWAQYRQELFYVMAIFNTNGVWKKIKSPIMEGEYDTALTAGLSYITFM